MKISTIKKLNVVVPDSIKVVFSKIIHGFLINNKEFIGQLKRLKEYDLMSEQSKENECYKQLRNTLIFAYEHTVYYNN